MMPRLMVVTPVYPPARGGIETLAEGIVARWRGPVDVVTLEEPGSADWDDRAGYRVHRAANSPRGGRRALSRLTALAVVKAAAFRPDVLLSMHVRCATAARAARRLTGARWVQYYHAKEIPTWAASSRRCLAAADHGIAVSRYTRSLLDAVAPAPGGVSVIPPGVAADRTVTGRPHPRPTILTVSRLSDAYKGHDVMLAALPAVQAAVPGVRWVIVGDGPLAGPLRAEATRLGLADTVEFAGAVDDHTRDELLRTSHVFALPSRAAADGRSGEGFGIVYVEAAAAGLPVVAGDSGGVVDAVHDGVSGLLVDPTDASEVAGALRRLLTDEPRRREMSAAARHWSCRFSWESVTPTLHRAILGPAAAPLVSDPDPAIAPRD